MLININPNVIDAAKKDINAKTALTLLAQIARCGNHIVVSESIAAIRKIQQINGLGVDVKSIYATIEKKLIQYGALKSKISTYAEVTYDNVPLYTKTTINQNIIIIPIEYFIQESCIADITDVIVENLIDADFYKFLGRYYIHMSGYSNVPLRYKPICGGGNTTNISLQSGLNSGHKFTICLADSDKHYPKDSYGDTLKQILHTWETANNNGVTHRHLCKVIFSDDIREIENLIPIPILKQINPLSGLEIDSINNKDSKIFLYMDIKDGLSYETFNTISAIEQNIYEQYLINNHLCDQKLLNEIKRKDKPLKNKTRLINGCGPSTLSIALNNYLSQAANKFKEIIAPQLTKDQAKVWMYIGKHFFEWACATPPIRS